MVEKLKGTCSRGFTFIRIKSGYVCAGAGHFIPHTLILKGGFYRIVTHGPPGRPATHFTMFGPFYSDSEARDTNHPGYKNPLSGRHFTDVWKVWADVYNGRYDRKGREIL